MSALQTSFNNNRHWSGERLSGAQGYFTNFSILQQHKYPWIGPVESRIPANQFEHDVRRQGVAGRAQAKTQHTGEDSLMFLFLAFFFAYAVCRVLL